MTKKERRIIYKQNHRCTNCGKPLSADRIHLTTCKECSAKHSQYVSQNAKFFKEMNICPRCGKNPLMGNEKNCPECRAKSWAYGIKYREEHPSFCEKKRETDRQRHNYRVEHHLCVRCGKPLGNSKYKNCDKCRTYNMLRMRKSRCKSGL